MENYDRQQDSGLFGEVEQDVFSNPSDREAVLEDAGQDDWGGGLLNWAIPQEEQGFVEGGYDPGSEYDPGFVPGGENTPGSEYDSGFVPEGEYTPGSEYDPGFIPEDKRNEELAEDVPAAGPWGGTPLLGMAGQEAGAGDSGNEEIEMPPEYVGRAEAAGQEQPNDAPVLLGAPPPEPVEQAGAGDGEIEIPPQYVGQSGADTAVDENDIEMLSDDAGQAGAGDGETGEIEFTPEEAAAVPSQTEAGDGETEMTGDEETDTTGSEDADLAARYDNVSDGNHPRFAFSSEEYLADYYRELYKQLNGSYNEPNMAELDTYDKLRTGVYKLWEQRDGIFEQHERDMDAYYKQWFKDKFGYESGEDDWVENSKYITGTKDLDEDLSTETTPGDAGQTGDDAKVDENDIEMLPNHPGQAGVDAADDGSIGIRGAFQKLRARHAGDEEIEMPPVVFGPADTGGGEMEEIEISPGEVAHWETQETYRQALEARYADELEFMGFNSHPDADQNYRELADQYKVLYKTLSDGKARHMEGTDADLEGVDTYEELKTEFYKLLHTRDLHLKEQQLEARYGKQVAEDPYLQTDEQIGDYYKNLYEMLYGEAPNMSGLGTYEEIKSRLFKVLEQRDSYLKQHEHAQPTEEEDENNVDDPVEPPAVDSDQAAFEGYHHDAGHEYVADYGDDLWG